MRVHPVKAFDDNYIWLIESTQDRVVVVDPGDDKPVIEWLKANKKDIAGYLITHHHHDHTGGLEALKARFPATSYGPDNPAIKGIDYAVMEGDTVQIAGLRFDVLATPGHTLDHISFYGDTALFCGDTLFSGGCGRMFEGTPELFVSSLDKLRRLPGETRVFCAHEYTQANLTFASLVEPDNAVLKSYLEKIKLMRQNDQITLPSTLQLGLTINPFLRFDQSAVRQAASDYAEQTLSSSEDVFGIIREWKDNA